MGRRRKNWKSISQMLLIFGIVAKMVTVQPVRDVWLLINREFQVVHCHLRINTSKCGILVITIQMDVVRDCLVNGETITTHVCPTRTDPHQPKNQQINQPSQVGLQFAVRHQVPNPTASIRNVIGRSLFSPQRVVNTGPITVWVTRVFLGKNVPNTLIGDTR